MVDHPQVQASGMIPETPNPAIPGYRDLSLPLRMRGERPRAERPPPARGEHTEDILRELGLTD